jgi:hypothetical protein
MRHEKKMIIVAADRNFDPACPLLRVPPLDRKYRFVDLSRRIPISSNSSYYPLTGGYHLLCLGKESASFAHHHWDALPEAMEAFLHLLALHELEPEIKKSQRF